MALVKEQTAPSFDDVFGLPLYTVAEAARYLQVGRSTLDTWAWGYVRGRPDRPVHGAPVISTVRGDRRGQASIPFGGLAEAYVLNAFRRAGVPLQRIRPSLARLAQEFGPHALASQRLKTDGAEVLWELGQEDADGDARAVAQRLVVPRTGQRVFTEVVEQYLRQITFDPSTGWTASIRLPQYQIAKVVVSPLRGAGKPTFAHGGSRVEDAVGPVLAGDPLDVVARDYGVPLEQLREAVRFAA